jgi:phospholipid-binding lipoprotein MlaA
MTRLVTRLCLFALVCALTGCATSAQNPRDPFENFNRAVFDFNDKVDEVALKPAAEAYQSVTPSFVQTGVGNFFGNIGDIWTSVNNLLQGKISDGLSDVMRVMVNSTVGLAGLIDVASDAGLPKHKEDFGQTLGRWGVPTGPYVVLPVLGPSTLRDTAALPVDISGDLWTYKRPVRWRNAGVVLRVVDQRAALLNATDLLEAAALDRYEFIRDGYMQQRENSVFDNGDLSKPAWPHLGPGGAAGETKQDNEQKDQDKEQK